MPASTSRPRYHGEPPLFLTSPLLSRAGLLHLFSTRHLPGVRPWRDPRGPFDAVALASVDRGGVPADGFAFARQVHGANVAAVTKPGFAGSVDVLTTDRPGLPLAIFTADCLPIIVFDRRGRRVAVAPARWRGTARSR